MEISAIRHIANKHFCTAVNDYEYLFRIHTKKNDIRSVVLHIQDKNLPVDMIDTRVSYEMEKSSADKYTDYYEVSVKIRPGTRCIRYFFELTDINDAKAFLGNEEFSDNIIEDIDRMYNFTCQFRNEERFRIPEWAVGSVAYQIFPARYATTKYVSESDWYKAPITNNTDLKGDIRGIINTLEHIADLGADVIYLTPVFKAGSVHKYDTIDYYQVDPAFGSNEDLKELVRRCHELGKKVILDGVFNHTSTEFFAFKDVTHNGADSRYKDWYYFEGFPVFMGSRKQPPNYLSFSYFGGMPKLNLTNPETMEYFINVGRFWINECDIDGWRLDVGDEISHEFMKKFRKAVKEIKPDVLIVGEDWQYGNDYLDGDEWDTIMNYSFFRMIKDFIMDEKISAEDAMNMIGHSKGFFHTSVFPVLWNLIDSHDTPRFLNLCGENRAKQKLAAAMMLLMPGMPMIYYGDEYGLTGAKDPDCRRGMLWDPKYQDEDTYEWYKALIRIRKKCPAIISGKIARYVTDNEKGLIVYECEADNHKFAVIFQGKDCKSTLDEYKGRTELIRNTVFSGEITGYNAAVIEL